MPGITRMDLVDFNQRQRDRWVKDAATSLPSGTKILDVGAGETPYRDLFSHCDYKTQDFAQYEGVATGENQQQWEYGAIDYVCDAAKIPVEDNSFDAILCTEVIEHTPEPIKVLQELSRILKPGGQLFLSAPLGSGLHQTPYHYYGGFSPAFYEKFLADFDFEDISVEPNGRFFKMLLQEIDRGMRLIYKKKPYPLWHPWRWVMMILSSMPFAKWLTKMDDLLPVDEFTTGYFVKGTKRKTT